MLGGKKLWLSKNFLLQKNADLEESKKRGSNVNASFCGSEVGIVKVIYYNRLSSLKKLVRVIGIVLRFLRNLIAFLRHCKVTKWDLEIQKNKISMGKARTRFY